MSRPGMLVVAGLTLVGATGFSTPALFAEPAVVGGGGGRVFTGSARDGFGCDVCHQGSDAPDIELDGLPDAWTAGATYTIQLRWSEGTGASSFVGEVVDDQGFALGSLATPPSDIIEPTERCAGGTPAARLEDLEDEGRTIFAIPACGATSSRFQWTAPETDEGSAWLHLGFVHGDDSDSPDGDGVRMIAREIPSAASQAASEGCRVDSGPGGNGWSVALVALVVLGGGLRWAGGDRS